MGHLPVQMNTHEVIEIESQFFIYLIFMTSEILQIEGSEGFYVESQWSITFAMWDDNFLQILLSPLE